MSTHRSARRSPHHSLGQRIQQAHILRMAAYILVSLTLAVLLISGNEAQARAVDSLRAAGVAVDGTITSLSTAQMGGRHPTYWVQVEFPAVSPAGRDLTLEYRYPVLSADFAALAVGERVPLIYTPDRLSAPQRAADLAAFDTGAMRATALAVAALYVLIGAGLSIADWRLRLRVSRRQDILRRAFGTR